MARFYEAYRRDDAEEVDRWLDPRPLDEADLRHAFFVAIDTAEKVGASRGRWNDESKRAIADEHGIRWPLLWYYAEYLSHLPVTSPGLLYLDEVGLMPRGHGEVELKAVLKRSRFGALDPLTYRVHTPPTLGIYCSVFPPTESWVYQQILQEGPFEFSWR